MPRKFVDDEEAFLRSYKNAHKIKKKLNKHQIAIYYFNNMKGRIKTKEYSKNKIEIKWTKEAFIEWFLSDVNVKRFNDILAAGETPSIDRINSKGHYEEANCRIIPNKLNMALGEVNGLISRMKTLQEYLKENQHWLQ